MPTRSLDLAPSIPAALLVLALSAPAPAQSAQRFDMGTSASPVAAGFTKVDAGSTWSPATGFGWLAGALRPYDRTATIARIQHELPVDLIRDGIASTTDCTFRIDLPNGDYLVIVHLGDVGTERVLTPRDNLDVLANGIEVVTDTWARTVGLKARFDTMAYGGFKRARFVVSPATGKLELTFHCDGTATSINSVMGIEVYPYTPPPVGYDHGTGSLVAAPAYRVVLGPALAAFNRHDYRTARSLLDGVGDPLARAWGYAWLCGWLTGDEQDADEALRPSKLFSMQQFRDLFSEQYLATDIQLSVGEQTILFTDMVGSTRFYGSRGDPEAFMLVRRHFAEVFAIVRDHHGAVIKTIGDAVMAAFTNPVDGLRAAEAIMRRYRAGDRDTDIVLRASLNTGPCIAVNLNSGIDYFGGTVNIAAKLQACADGGQVAFSAALADEPGVAEALRARATRLRPTTLEHPALPSPVAVTVWDVHGELAAAHPEQTAERG